MRFCLFLSCLLAVAFCRAQPSRVVFFCPDADADSFTLRKDGEAVGGFRAGSAFVYDAALVRGNYTTMGAVNALSSNKLHVPELPAGIVFVRYSAGDARMKLVSFPEFENCFGQSGSMRKGLKGAGFATPEALTKGYAMVSVDERPATGHRPGQGQGLQDTLFLGRYDLPATRENADFFRILKADSIPGYRVAEYYWPEGTLKSRYHCVSPDLESREGLYEAYQRNGRLDARGNYNGNRREGQWRFFRDTPSNYLWYTCEYENGERNGRQMSFYPSKKTRRVELWRSYTVAVFPNVAGSGPVRIHEEDSLISGHRYDTSGREISFTPLEVAAKPRKSLNAHLSSTLRYPEDARDKGIQGRVVVTFMIDKLGQVRNAEAIRAVHEDLDREALRVVNAMPPWQPGSLDDEPAETTFTLPVTFSLD